MNYNASMKKYLDDDITGKTSNLNSHKIIEEVLKDLKKNMETLAYSIDHEPVISSIKSNSFSKSLTAIYILQSSLNFDDGEEIDGNSVQCLLELKSSWPGQMRTIYGDHNRFFDTYFSQFSGYYFTGDGARRDEDGYYWITGRGDDVLNISGHRIGTAEVEGAIGKADGVAEAAVVGFPHEIKGQGIYAFVTLMTGEEPSDKKLSKIIESVVKDIGPHAKPDKIQFTPALPKTRSGKIMRRILRKIAEKDTDNMGDISTLADPSVVENLILGSSQV